MAGSLVGTQFHPIFIRSFLNAKGLKLEEGGILDRDSNFRFRNPGSGFVLEIITLDFELGFGIKI